MGLKVLNVVSIGLLKAVRRSGLRVRTADCEVKSKGETRYF